MAKKTKKKESMIIFEGFEDMIDGGRNLQRAVYCY